MRRSASLALLLVLLSSGASAHTETTFEKAILQLRGDRTQLLYELSFPQGPDAARWRMLYDLDRNGLLSADEYARLAEGLAAEVRKNVHLRIEGNLVPWRVLDAKVTPGGDGDGFSGRLQALVYLDTRDIPAGLRKIELSLVPVVRPTKPALVVVESPVGPLKSLVGGRRAEAPDGGDAVGLAAGDACTMLVDAQPAPTSAR